MNRTLTARGYCGVILNLVPSLQLYHASRLHQPSESTEVFLKIQTMVQLYHTSRLSPGIYVNRDFGEPTSTTAVVGCPN
jgi:hypothetical protein